MLAKRNVKLGAAQSLKSIDDTDNNKDKNTDNNARSSESPRSSKARSLCAVAVTEYAFVCLNAAATSSPKRNVME